MKGLQTLFSGQLEGASNLYTPLNDVNKSKNDNITPFAHAGFFSKMGFCWLNPLMKLGRIKTLEENDMPLLRDEDTARYCYSEFGEKLNEQKERECPTQLSILWTIIQCHLRDILVSGFFAFLKTLAMSAGPLLLNAFIKVAQGEGSFRYESYVLAISLFLVKILESLCQRQWFFRSRLMGLQIRSMLTAAIYRKQQRLSNIVRETHTNGNIMNYVTVDAFRIGEFPYWLHQTWTTTLQICLGLIILINAIGLATVASLILILLSLLCNFPLAKLQHKYQSALMVSQDKRLKACSEALTDMKILKLYAWESHFRMHIEKLRKVEIKHLKAVQTQKAINIFIFWASPVVVTAASFGACYFLEIPLHANNVFTFLATLSLVQIPITNIPDIIAIVIQARVAFARIVEFLTAPEIQSENVNSIKIKDHVSIRIKSANVSWDLNTLKPTLRNINLDASLGEKIAICGEVGSGKSTLLAAILGEVPYVEGTVEACGRIAYVSQNAWIQTGTIRENILFGSAMDNKRYKETLSRCSLLKDIELLPYGDMTEIGERGVGLSGGQKQRIQLARALYQDADIYLLDDPFSAVDAHTSTSLFNEYVMGALDGKIVLLVTHQVDFLPAFHRCLLMSDGEVLHQGPYHELIASSKEFLDLVNANKETAGSETATEVSTSNGNNNSTQEIKITKVAKDYKAPEGNQLIMKEEKEVGNSGFKAYWIYVNQKKGLLLFSILLITHFTFLAGQTSQNIWMASSVDDPQVSDLRLISVYLIIGSSAITFLLIRSFALITLGLESSQSLFNKLLNSLFRAPMSFYDSTPLGRIISRIATDLSIIDLDLIFSILRTLGSTSIALINLGIISVTIWEVLLVALPVVYIALQIQRGYYATAKQLMRLNGTTKSLVANHLAESLAGAMTIRAFEQEERFFAKNLDVIDINASPFFHNFAASEWLVQRVETLGAIVLAAASLFMVLLPPGTFSPGFIGLALSYGLSLNGSMVWAIQYQCVLSNQIISVERLNQYMDLPSEAPEIIDDSRPPQNWPLVGKVEIHNLQIRYRENTPLVLKGISCTFEGGDRIGIVGRTGSGKTTLIGALFRLVEPAGGKIIVDGVDICAIGLHDLRSRFGIIPQEPTLFNGTIRFNLDPLHQHSDDEIWQVLVKCQLKEAIEEKTQGLDSPVAEDGSNWSMGQRQLFCLGRALLRRSKVLVLDEATASIDNATDMIMQKTIRREFAGCTMITVAHRIPTVMDCTKVLAMSDGNLVEYDEPIRLLKREDSLFGKLVREYWSHSNSADRSHLQMTPKANIGSMRSNVYIQENHT